MVEIGCRIKQAQLRLCKLGSGTVFRIGFLHFHDVIFYDVIFHDVIFHNLIFHNTIYYDVIFHDVMMHDAQYMTNNTQCKMHDALFMIHEARSMMHDVITTPLVEVNQAILSLVI